MKAKHIQDLVNIVEKSNIDEIEITRWWGYKVRIRKTSSYTIVPRQDTRMTDVAVPAPQPQAAPSAAAAPAAPAAEEPAAVSNHIEITAPMVGTFYRAASPDDPPFVKENDSISTGQVLCIIEAMKLMNEIEAEISGKIVKVLVENGEAIEYGQPLFLIDPS